MFEPRWLAAKGKNREAGLQVFSVRKTTGRRIPSTPYEFENPPRAGFLIYVEYFSFQLLAYIPVEVNSRRGFFCGQPIAWEIWRVFGNCEKSFVFMLTRLGRKSRKDSHKIENKYANIRYI